MGSCVTQLNPPRAWVTHHISVETLAKYSSLILPGARVQIIRPTFLKYLSSNTAHKTDHVLLYVVFCLAATQHHPIVGQ